MTVQDLINLLKRMDPDAEVRFASQPSWPFEYEINDVVEVQPPNEDEYDDDEEAPDLGDDPVAVVYLVEGSQLGYLPSHVKSEIGWR